MSQTAQEYINEGIELDKAGEYSKAVEKYSVALSLQSSHPQALYSRAKSYVRLQKLEQAINDFNDLIAQNDSNAFFYSERAVAFHLNGNNELAIADLDKAVELEPNKPFRYSSRAYIREKSGDLKGALEDYDKTIALDPEDAIAFNNKGLIEEKLGYIEKSKASFQKADDLDPNKKPAADKQQVSDKPKAPATQKETTIEVKASDQKLTFGGYLDQVKSLLSDKEERKAFGKYVKGIFFSNKD
ncbi:tetratricopeptide repeat protein [Fulvivirga ligni]|uniref:tetratricopeptide repeat protein n=1 Tax=Fulvivirga ligni TaxID=2904246 RepID=UPI001F43DC58|nr:tetratricopeptide repeat protein [Fulvivirga ligni]UII19746.1 tetratricopeptide repeat protein [Fulvivirga ligni]